MYTISETPVFQKHIEKIWTESERLDFCSWLARNPFAGDVVPNTGGLRKVRWKRRGMGKTGGVRVIYYNILEQGHIWLLIAYTKAEFDNLPSAFLRELKGVIDG